MAIGGCFEKNPNLDEEGKDLLLSNEVFMDAQKLAWRDTVYVPIYSDVYSEPKDARFQLTATLSLRNTSLRDSLFISRIDYYDTDGAKVREYIKDKTLVLKPMQSLEYVIAEKDTDGGYGANFIICWGARNHFVNPVFQGVMLSTYGTQGISFVTDGVSISERAAEPPVSNDIIPEGMTE